MRSLLVCSYGEDHISQSNTASAFCSKRSTMLLTTNTTWQNFNVKASGFTGRRLALSNLFNIH